jgi:hypothetical protein
MDVLAQSEMSRRLTVSSQCGESLSITYGARSSAALEERLPVLTNTVMQQQVEVSSEVKLISSPR